MKIYNEKVKYQAKVAVIRGHIKGLSDLTYYGKLLREKDIDPTEIIYISLFDTPIGNTLSVSDLRVAVGELTDLLKSLNISLLVDDVGFQDSKRKYHSSCIMDKILHKDTSLWELNGVLLTEFDDFTIKIIAGFRPETVKREMESRLIIDNEFKISIPKCKIKRVTSSEEAKKIFKSLYANSDEIFYDTETSHLRWEHIDAKILTAQITGSQDKDLSYVFWIDHNDMNVDKDLKSIIGKGLKWILESGKKIFIHNANFDLLWTKKHLVPDLDFYNINIYDTMLIYHFLTNSIEKVSVGLKESSFLNKICQDWESDLEVKKKELCSTLKIKKDDFSYEMFPTDMLEKYAGLDTIVLAYYWDMLQELNENHIARPEIDFIKETWETNWQPIMQSLQWTIWYGVPFDIEVAKKQLAEKDNELTRLYDNILEDENTKIAERNINKKNFEKAMISYNKKVEAALEKGKEFKGAIPQFEKGNYGQISFDITFNPSSLDHKRVLFFEVLGLRILNKTDTGAPSVGGADITQWCEERPEIDVIKHFNDIITIEKEVSTYLIPFIEMSETSFDGFIRGNPTPLNTSLRLRTKTPNVLNLPKTEFKKCVAMPNKDFIYQLDYSALESILSLNHTEDESRLAQYNAGIEDSHSVNAIIWQKAIGNPAFRDLSVTSIEDVSYVKKTYPDLRQSAKAITFALQYLGSYRSIQFGLNIPEDSAKIIYGDYWNTYKGEREFFKQCVHEMATKGYLKFFSGGVILTPNIDDDPEDDEVLKVVRTPFNTTSQSGAWITLRALDKAMRKFRREGIEWHPFLSVYDSIIYSCRDEDAVYIKKTLIEFMTEKYKDNQVVTLKADGEIGFSYKAVRDFEGTDEELKQIIKEMRSEVNNK